MEGPNIELSADNTGMNKVITPNTTDIHRGQFSTGCDAMVPFSVLAKHWAILRILRRKI